MRFNLLVHFSLNLIQTAPDQRSPFGSYKVLSFRRSCLYKPYSHFSYTLHEFHPTNRIKYFRGVIGIGRDVGHDLLGFARGFLAFFPAPPDDCDLNLTKGLYR